MKGIVIFAAALFAEGPAPDEAADLAWLAGAWVSESGDRWTEERWSPPRGGTMLGMSLVGRGGKAGGFEFMRIAPDKDGRLAFWAMPDGAPASAFPLVAGGKGEAVFENPAHDYPTRITYARKGRVLTATIEGPGGANRKSWSFRRRGD